MKLILSVLLALSLVGCTSNSIYRTFDISKGESPMVDIRQRAILVSKNGDSGPRVCAEPSPDAMASFASELASKLDVANKGGAELAYAMNDSAAFTGIRTQSIQLLRDFGYRLCEAYMSGSITPLQYDLLMRRYQKNTVALLAIEQLTGTVKAPLVALTSSGSAEATKNLSEQRAEREKINDQIDTLQKQIDATQKQSDAAKTAKSDTATFDAQIADMTAKMARLKSDLVVVDDAIANSKGVVAGGKTEVTIKVDPTASGQKTDQQIATIAGVVDRIVNKVVLSDDKTQICLSVLQGQSRSREDDEFKRWCLVSLNNDAERDRIYLSQSIDEIEEANKVLASPHSTPTQKSDAKKKKQDIKKDVKSQGSSGLYSQKLKLE